MLWNLSAPAVCDMHHKTRTNFSLDRTRKQRMQCVAYVLKKTQQWKRKLKVGLRKTEAGYPDAQVVSSSWKKKDKNNREGRRKAKGKVNGQEEAGERKKEERWSRDAVEREEMQEKRIRRKRREKERERESEPSMTTVLAPNAEPTVIDVILENRSYRNRSIRHVLKEEREVKLCAKQRNKKRHELANIVST